MNVLAHEGGWDEIAMVAGPLLVFAAVLFLVDAFMSRPRRVA